MIRNFKRESSLLNFWNPLILRIYKDLKILIILMSFALPVEGQFHFSKDFKSKNKDVRAVYERFAKLPELRGSSYGVIVKDASSGQNLIHYNQDLNLIPASNMKLFTSLNGLKNLGSDFTFKTKFWVSGPIENGILKGSLWIEGSGDPSIYSPDKEKFGDNFFTKLNKVLKSADIQKIEGQMYAKEINNPYSGIRSDWSWSDVGNYYGAGIYPLNINENRYSLFLSATAQGKAAKIKKRDSISDVEVTNEDVITDGPNTPDLAYIYWKPGSTDAKITGSLPQDSNLQKVKGALQNPEKVFFKVLTTQLSKAGITVEGKQFEVESLKEIGFVESPPLKEIVKEVNLLSNNLMTESIAFALAKKEDKLDESGWTQLTRFANQINCPQGFYLADGSGLSPSNRISPEGFCKALFWAKKQTFYADLMASLPVSGTSGTMRNFCKSPAAKGKIQAKSGTLTRTLCYSGYAKAKRGDLVFSIMINSYSGNFKAMKSELEKIMEALVEIK